MKAEIDLPTGTLHIQPEGDSELDLLKEWTRANLRYDYTSERYEYKHNGRLEFVLRLPGYEPELKL